MITIISSSEEITMDIGRIIGETVHKGDIILLSGDLGAGKTVLSKGIAKGLGATEMVTSPTYALMNEYQGRYPIYHFDIYRLTSSDDLYDLDYEDYFYGDGVTIVEWPERMEDLLPDSYLKIVIEKTHDKVQRKINIIFHNIDNETLKEVLLNYEGACC